MRAETFHEAARRRRRQQILQGALAALLVAFVLWCLALLVRTHRLRAELATHLAWHADVRQARGELDRLRAGLLGGDAAPADLGARLERARSAAELFVAGRQEPDLRVALRNLEAATGALATVLAEPDDQPWEVSAAASAALLPLEEGLAQRLTQLRQELDGEWRSLNLLVLASLLLAASNLLLLALAHHRRLELERSHAEVLRQATHDPLTELWNREAILRLLREELERSRRGGTPCGVILADLDGFGELNALVGEDRGDDVLQELAHRLGTLLRPYDTLGRYGGDSFLAVLPSCDAGATARVAERLAAAIAEREFESELGNHRLTATCAHAAVDHPEERIDPDLLVHRLQEALGKARAEGPGGLVAAR